MDNVVNDMIQSFGFPVAVAVGCGWFIWKIYWSQQEDNRKDKERLYTVLAEVNQTNASILQANKEILDTNRGLMTELQRDISDIKEAVIR